MPSAHSNRAAHWLVNADSLHVLSAHYGCATLHSVLFSSGEPGHGQGDQGVLESLVQGTQGALRPLSPSCPDIPSPAASDRTKISLVSFPAYKCLFNLSNLLSTSTQKPEKYLVWDGNSPRCEIIASQVLVIHGMALIALYLGDPVHFFCNTGLESIGNLNKWNE